MSKLKKELNPKLVKGDRIMCLHMDGETSVPMGTTGTVVNVGIDPFEQDNELIQVRWDNGSSLALVSATDTWVKIAQETLEESKTTTLSSEYNFLNDNPEIFDRKLIPALLESKDFMQELVKICM
jgi:hypothetical protein